jgi:hypothetical protein
MPQVTTTGESPVLALRATATPWSAGQSNSNSDPSGGTADNEATYVSAAVSAGAGRSSRDLCA